MIEEAPGPERIAFPGRFDLDHLGAEVRQQRAGEGPRDQLPDFDHPQPVQRPRRAGPSGFGRHACTPASFERKAGDDSSGGSAIGPWRPSGSRPERADYARLSAEC